MRTHLLALGLLAPLTQSRPAPAGAPAEDLQGVVAAQNDFAFALHRALVAGAPGEDAFASPLSVWTALAMLGEGAEGATAREIARALWGDAPPTLAGIARQRERLAALAGPVSLDWADALWGQAGFPFRAATLERLQTTFGAGLRTADFAEAPEAWRERINAWVAEVTHDRILDLLPEGSIDPLTRLVLTDAIHFQGDWARPFDPDDTAPLAFLRADGTAVEVPFLRDPEGRTVSLARLDRDGEPTDGEACALTAVELPYVGGALSFVALMPSEAADLAAFERDLDGARLTRVLAHLAPRRARLEMPMLELEHGYDLRGALRALGIERVLGRDAELGGLTDVDADLYLSGAYHKAFLRVDEQGTEAAAATGLVVVTRAVERAPLVRLDRPFVFLIRDRESGTVLFLGRVADPSR